MKTRARQPAVKHWRVFYTLPRAEKRCEERLREQRVEAFLPKYTAVRQWKDRKKKVTEPLFRNYVFARVDDRERLRALQTQGIVRCITFGGKIAEVDPEEIEQLKILQGDPERLAAVSYSRFQIGEHVAVTEGPMEGLRGEVIEHRGQQYVVIRVHAIRQAVRVHVPAQWIRPSSPPLFAAQPEYRWNKPFENGI